MAVDPTISNISEIITAYLAANGLTVVPVTAEAPLPVVLPAGPLATSFPTLFPQAWTSSTTKDMRTYSGATVQVHGLSGGDTIQVSESWDNANAVVQSWIKNDFTVGNTISTDGNYSFIGGGYMTYAKTGSASTPTLTIMGNN